MKIIISCSPASGIFTVLISASLTDCMISISSSHEPFPRSDPDVSVQLKISHFSVSAGRQVHVEATGGDITSIVSPSWPIRRRQTKETELRFSCRHINTTFPKSSVFSDLKRC